MFDSLFAIWFSVGKVSVSYIEATAFVLALACVWCNVKEIHWGWPLAIVSSALYVVLFYHSKLYGDAGIQLFFIASSMWGWWQWLFGANKLGSSPAESQAKLKLEIRHFDHRQMALVAVIWCGLWLLLGLLLSKFTDSDVAWADAFPTAGGMIGQILLGKKVLQNWLVWQLVNLAMIGLLAYKGLWLTMLLYVIFLAMAVLGWRRWAAVSAQTGLNTDKR